MKFAGWKEKPDYVNFYHYISNDQFSRRDCVCTNFLGKEKQISQS